MPKLDPDSMKWYRRAKRREKPFAYMESNDVIVLSFVRNHDWDIKDEVGHNGHACWRAINRSTTRHRRVRLHAELRDQKAVWQAVPQLYGQEFPINSKISRSQKSEVYYAWSDWSTPFEARHPGTEAVVTKPQSSNTLLESAFVIHPSYLQGSGTGSHSSSYTSSDHNTASNSGSASSSDGSGKTTNVPRIFISHSSIDKPFVRRLAEDLRKYSLEVWLDEDVLRVGDSIVDGISKGLKESDYLIAVLSAASAQSSWMQAELNATLMHQMDEKGAIILPVRIDNTDLPPLLRDRIYADFRAEYQSGLDTLLGILLQEYQSADGAIPKNKVKPTASHLVEKLANLKLAELRRLITHRLSRNDVSVLWFDVLNSSMDDYMANRELASCVIELLVHTQRQDVVEDLIKALLDNHPNITKFM